MLSLWNRRECSNHGYRFDLKTGECDCGERFNTRVYPIKIVEDNILIGASHQRTIKAHPTLPYPPPYEGRGRIEQDLHANKNV